MLVELAVENLAVVERLRLRLHPGFNALTGETGSGKSLIVGALSLLFGGRASADMIRTGEERAFVSGIFEAPADARFRELLEQAGVAAEDGELLVEREITASGKSRAWAGSRPVTIAFLREIAPFLGDIHGQHDQQKLFSPEAQRERPTLSVQPEVTCSVSSRRPGSWDVWPSVAWTAASARPGWLSWLGRWSSTCAVPDGWRSRWASKQPLG